MNKKNREKVEQIKSIISTLSDMTAITEIDNFLYNSRARINRNADREKNQQNIDE